MISPPSRMFQKLDNQLGMSPPLPPQFDLDMVKLMANIRNRREQRSLVSGVDVLGLLLARLEEVGAGCSTLKVDSTFLFLSLFIF